MGTTADKLQGVVDSKEAIRQAIIEKGVDVAVDTVLSEYATKISSIQSGGSEVIHESFTTAGDYTWTPPEGVEKIDLFIVGSGDIGNSYTDSTSYGTGNGGQCKTYLDVDVREFGTAIPLHVGAAQTKTSVSNGEDSWFYDSNLYVAKKGRDGLGAKGGTKGTTSARGGNGENGTYPFNDSNYVVRFGAGGGGCSAADSATSSTLYFGGSGGNHGAGNGTISRYDNYTSPYYVGNSIHASLPGSGGGGSSRGTNVIGLGAAGCVIIRYAIPSKNDPDPSYLGTRTITINNLQSNTPSSWSAVANMTNASNVHPAACEYNENLWVFTTASLTGYTYARRYNSALNSWTDFSYSTAYGKYHREQECAVIGSKAYLIGGNIFEASYDYESNFTAGTTHYCYDFELNSWTSRAILPRTKAYFACHAYGNKIYTFPGISTRASSSLSPTMYDYIDVYDSELNSWTSTYKSNLHGSAVAASAIIGDNVHLIGGWSSTEKVTNNHFVYNISLDSVTKTYQYPLSVAGAAACEYNGNIYTFGGYSNISYSVSSGYSRTRTQNTYIYNPELKSWYSDANMTVALCYHRSIVVNNNIYVVGGNATDSTGNASSTALRSVNTIYKIIPGAPIRHISMPFSFTLHMNKPVLVNGVEVPNGTQHRSENGARIEFINDGTSGTIIDDIKNITLS